MRWSGRSNGPGGQIEQSYLYTILKAHVTGAQQQRAICFCISLNSSCLQKIAERDHQREQRYRDRCRRSWLWGRKTETELMQRLADLVPSPPDSNCISPTLAMLLSEGYRTALNALAPRRIPVFAIHGDFNDIARNPLHSASREHKNACDCSDDGATSGNIRDEPWFFVTCSLCNRRAIRGSGLWLCFAVPSTIPERFGARSSHQSQTPGRDFTIASIRSAASAHPRLQVGDELRTELYTLPGTRQLF